jgi:UDP-2,4-diacetamido-2,4,6-trideoxy-beta-L-altropyranose hydrolase
MDERVLIRVDADEKIGMGHFVRCLALGEMLKIFFHVIMIVKHSTRDVRNKIKESGLDFKELKSEDSFIQHISPDDIVVLDGYDFTEGYQNSAKTKGCRLVYIDDMKSRHTPADAIINPGPGITEDQYDTGPYTGVYAGTDYALLRKEFRKNRAVQLPQTISTAFVCFGGADPHNLTDKALRALEGCPGITKINIILGSAFRYLDHLNISIQNTSKEVCLFQNLDAKHLINTITDSDIALVPSSTIMLECFSTGIACVTGAYADNQKNYAAFAEEKGAAYVLDNWLEAGEDEIARAVNKISIDEARKQIGIQKQIIDGYSDIRLSSIFLGLRPAGKLHVKRAGPEDANLLFDWANEPDVRRNSINTEPIAWETHVAWFGSRINSPDFILYILYESDGPVGQIRFDAHDAYYEINFSIDKNHRGKGFGKAIIVLGMNELISEKGHKKIRFHAKVKKFNVASMRTFESLGFKPVKTSEDIAYFEYE